MKKQILNLGKALDKAEQKEINGGDLRPICSYYCSGTTAKLSTRTTYCLLNYPAIIYDSPMCGGNDEGPGEVWA